MPLSNKIMSQVLIDKVGQTTTMEHYYDPNQSSNVLEWDLEYKNLVMIRLIPMLADMKPMQAQMGELLSLGQTNPFDVVLDVMTAQALTEVSKKWSTDPCRRSPTDTNNNQTENASRKKDDSKVGLHVAGPSTAPNNTMTTEFNNDVNDNRTNTLEAGQPDAQFGLAAACDDYILSVKEL